MRPLGTQPATTLLSFGLTAAMALFAVGCDSVDCETTCNKLYQPAEPNCGLQSAGFQTNELLELCNSECNEALETPGEPRKAYKPAEYTPSNDDSVIFTNDEEVALWMDCVSETACDKLSDGFCAPIW
jgi:hypothetical protein